MLTLIKRNNSNIKQKPTLFYSLYVRMYVCMHIVHIKNKIELIFFFLFFNGFVWACFSSKNMA